MDHIKAVPWLAKATFVAALTIGLCALITPMTRDIPPLPPLTKDDEAEPALTRYRREVIPDIALVGSSLTYRLNESYFLPLKVRNLAISGDSSLTGLQIISSYPQVPKLILVEANIVSRDIDASLVRRFSGKSLDLSILRPMRMAVAYFNSRPERPAESINSFEDMLRQPPETHDNALAIQRAIEQYGKTDQDAAIVKNAEILNQLVSSLAARGSRVYLFELPYPKTIEDTHFAVTNRIAVHRRFSDPDQWLRLDYTAGEMRFEDHVHLDKRSALIVSRAMEAEISTLLRSQGM
jgi:hypothetical protein